jgi:hypothetical protein
MLAQTLEQGRLLADQALEQLLPAATQYPASIHQAMRHSVFAGGTLSYIAESGSIGDYLDSLARLRCFGLQALYPGHGRVSTTPLEDIDQAICNAQMLLETRTNEKVDIFYQNAHETVEPKGREGALVG